MENNNKMTLESLEAQVLKQQEARKERYNLARELGFSAAEANILQNRSADNIRKLAEERKAQETKTS